MIDQQAYAEKAHAAAQDFLGDEPVLAAMHCSRGGGWGALAASQVSPLVGTLMSRKDKQRAGGLPQMFLVALTPTHLVALKLPMMNLNAGKVRVVKEIARWNRSGLRISTEEVFHGTQLLVEPADGPPVVIKGPPGEITSNLVGLATRTDVA